MRPDRGRGGRRFPIGRTRPLPGARGAPVSGGGRRRHGCAPASPRRRSEGWAVGVVVVVVAVVVRVASRARACSAPPRQPPKTASGGGRARPDRGRGGRRFPIGRTRPGLGARGAPVGGGGRRRHGCAPASPHPALQAATSTSPGCKTENKKKSTPSCRGERNVGVVGRVPASSPLRPPGRRSGVARATQVATGHGLDAQTRRRTHGCALTRRARKCPDRTTREGVCKKSSQFCERAQRPPRQRSVQGPWWIRIRVHGCQLLGGRAATGIPN